MKTTLEWSFDIDAMHGCRRPMLLAFTNDDREAYSGLLAHVKDGQIIDSITGQPLISEVVYAWAPLAIPSIDDAARYAQERSRVGGLVR